MQFIVFLRDNARWLGGGFLLFFFSSFGQTFLISLSAGDIRLEYALSHGQFGSLYMAATLASALTLPRLGHMVDHYSAKKVTLLVVPMLALAAACMALSRHIVALFVVSAVESLSDSVLDILDKGHTRDDVVAALRIVRDAGMSLRPTFVPFTPWTTLDDYLDLCRFIVEHDLEDEVDPIQMTIRLLVPPGSLLLGRDELRPFLGPLDQAALAYRWTHPDPRMDHLYTDVAALVEHATRAEQDPGATFQEIHALALNVSGSGARPPATPANGDARRRRGADARAAAPRLSEPWFCCSEPSRIQLRHVGAPSNTGDP
jgi:hypothetical protein